MISTTIDTGVDLSFPGANPFKKKSSSGGGGGGGQQSDYYSTLKESPGVRAHEEKKPEVNPLLDRLAGYRRSFKEGIGEGRDFAARNLPFSGMVNPQLEKAIGLRTQFAEQGLGSPVLQALRSNAIGGINQTLAQNLQGLRSQQGAAGVRGGAALAQQQRLREAALGQRQQFENQLMGQDVAFRQQNLGDLERRLAGINAANIGAQLGFGGIGLQMQQQAQATDLADRLLGIAQGDLDIATAPQGGGTSSPLGPAQDAINREYANTAPTAGPWHPIQELSYG